MQIDRNGLEVLGRAVCLQLLGGATVGRLAITSRALPTVLPVTFRLVGDSIIIRTGRGTKLDAATRNAVVAFEIDEIDASAQSGWSVVVTGMTREVDRPAEIAALQAEIGPWWLPADHGRFVAISTEMVSGRRLHARPVDAISGAEER